MRKPKFSIRSIENIILVGIIVGLVKLIFFSLSTASIQFLRMNVFAAMGIIIAVGTPIVVFKGLKVKKKVSPSLEKQIKVTFFIVKCIIPLVVVIVLITLVFPILQDDFLVLMKRGILESCLIKQGEVIKTDEAILGLWFFYQDICFSEEECYEDIKYTSYLNSYIFHARHKYRIYYLPYSRTIIKFEEIR